MTREEFIKLSRTVRVRLVWCPEGLLLTGITQQELAECMKLAGWCCGVEIKDAGWNTEMLCQKEQ